MTMKKLTAKFYRITEFQSGHQIPSRPIDWGALIGEYRNRQAADRVVELRGIHYYFEPRDTGSRHLAVHRFKEAGDVFSKIARDGGAVTEIPAVDEHGYFADTSCVVFLGFGSIFGLVTGGSSAPRAGKVAEWLTGLDPFADKTVYGVEPVTLKPELDKLKTAEGASRVSMRVPIEVVDQLGGGPGVDGTRFSSLAPGSTATLTVSYGRRTPKVSEGIALLRLAKALSRLVTGDSSADASIYHSVPSARKGKTKLEGELLDLVEHELATSFAIGEQTGEVRIDSIMALIDNGANTLMSDLKRAWEACNVGQGQELVD